MIESFSSLDSLRGINLIPLRNQIDSGSRVYGVPLVQVQKTERKSAFNLKNHDSSFPVAAWQTSTNPRHRAEVSCHRRGINRVLCVFFLGPVHTGERKGTTQTGVNNLTPSRNPWGEQVAHLIPGGLLTWDQILHRWR